MSFIRLSPVPDNDPAASLRPPPLNGTAITKVWEAEQEAISQHECDVSRAQRLARLIQWRRDVKIAQENGYGPGLGEPPLQFPEPSEGMRRNPHTGKFMGEFPRNEGF